MGVNTAENLRLVLEHLRTSNREPSLLLATGDITQDGSQEGYEAFLEHASRLDVPVHVLPGNHDSANVLRSTLGPVATPVIDLEHWRIVMLDSTLPDRDDGLLGEDQLAMLDRISRADDPRHVLVAMHHQPVRIRSEWLDTMAIANADRLFEILHRFPQVRALAWGHVHQAYDGTYRFSKTEASRALKLMATPATCFQFTPRSARFDVDSKAPGYRWITLHADGTIETTVTRISGPFQTPTRNSGGY